LGTRSFLYGALIILVLSFAISILPIGAQEPITPEQLVKAKEELVKRLEARSRAKLEGRKYIMPNEKIEDASLGEPYAVYRIEPERVQELTDYNQFNKCLTFCLWRIPVFFGKHARIVLGLYYDGGEWKIASYGGEPGPIEDARSHWPESEGYKLSYIFEIMGPDFIMIQKENDIWLYPLRERNERLLGVTKDLSGRYPLLTVPYVVKRLKEGPKIRIDPKMD
jgi:hypothetical protein